MRNTNPRVSIVIPTHNRARLLNESLAALARQTFPSRDTEVIVVADSCHDDTPAVLRHWSEQAPFALKSLSHTAGSAARTRNLGAQQARGEILLFLDDDVIAWPDLVAVHAAEQDQAAGRGELCVGLGYSKPVFPPRPSFWQKNARLWWEDRFREMDQPGHRFTFRDFFSGNVSLPAPLFNSVTGFDASIKGRGLEDYELGIRLLKTGARFRFLPKAMGLHYDGTTLDLWLRRLRQEGIAYVHMGTRHPELKAVLFSNWGYEDERWGELRHWIRRLAFFHLPFSGAVTAVLFRLANLCEYLRLRKGWWQVVNVLHEYLYWSGVASELGSEASFAAWLVDGSPLPAVDHLAVVIDLAGPLDEKMLSDTLPAASQHGLRVTWRGIEVFTLAAQPGSEPLRMEHVQTGLKQLAGERFVPALAVDWIRSTGGEIFRCPPA